jgi:hypothetical protein
LACGAVRHARLCPSAITTGRRRPNFRACRRVRGEIRAMHIGECCQIRLIPQYLRARRRMAYAIDHIALVFTQSEVFLRIVSVPQPIALT